jgi:TonB family protein
MLKAQTEAKDTTIYTALEIPPRFPACEELDTTLAFKNQCAQQALLNFMYQNLRYPLEAQQQNLEGQVVVSFVVEKDGTLSRPEVLKDIGGGAGLEVIRLVQAMNEYDVVWVPGQKDGQPVRAKFTLPIRFELEEAKPYVLVGRDSIYTDYDEPLNFKGGQEALTAFMEAELTYPKDWQDSCYIGRIDLQVLVRPNGDIRILDMTDYNDLGFDFWYAAIDAATSTYGNWDVAEYEGRKVGGAYDLQLPFVPSKAGCATVVEKYKQADKLANEGADLFNEGEKEAGVAKLDEAIGLFPRNAEFRMMRGQAYMDMKEFDKACEDLSLARSIALINYYDEVLPIICNK